MLSETFTSLLIKTKPVVSLITHSSPVPLIFTHHQLPFLCQTLPPLAHFNHTPSYPSFSHPESIYHSEGHIVFLFSPLNFPISGPDDCAPATPFSLVHFAVFNHSSAGSSLSRTHTQTTISFIYLSASPPSTPPPSQPFTNQVGRPLMRATPAPRHSSGISTEGK